MKIRQAFVANSSSSSFICEICGHTETGYDGGYSDFGYIECVNGHVICDEHLLGQDEDCPSYEVPEQYCPICQFQEYSQPEMVEYLKKVYKVEWNDVFQIIKSVNRRRKKLYASEYITEVLKQNNITDDSVMEALRSQFSSYDEFIKFTRETN
jgi:hypothetical protein